ncbi:bifunctional adenosylcobinamide kinase/adenosylcobinamide-phosphate guanylyltransferase [Iodobacter fluviatilis]|uniref:Bifunctional adenosylcobalamin biosynthesis protein n=1 Tax=Iodobacter fluviatilis TaxID=537 RepID=A0A377SVJ0_9NEIS|nr:bifunctional adenosylcobinamide kinase/adenosylcobinamide-phosphate guanylyltransferase [Iodobacter fluviatilis]TCU87847.1 adenosylcobinamide kinase /adenosylcobinamide-phosphate guanylyltransferase [Iodobacter fluviatilis]STR45348.1 Adenosylcobinamide kinase [Iodobacter fluviatilis]
MNTDPTRAHSAGWPVTELILGGARSGKSGYALAKALAHDGQVFWLATAQAFDEEMQERIIRHKAERPAHWQTREAPLQLATALAQSQDQFCVIDCLTLWLSNWLCKDDLAGWAQEKQAFITAAAAHRGTLLLVSNEVGFGIVPDNALARLFRDEAGRLHQDIARQAANVTLVVAGIPMPVKRSGC